MSARKGYEHAATVYSQDDAEAAVQRLSALIARAISTALAERDAGEAERVAHAVAVEREACADIAFDLAGDGGSLVTWRAIRARATSPAPVAAPADGEVERLRDVIRTGGAMLRAERAILGVPGGIDPAPEPHPAGRAAADAAKAARARGEDVYADGEGRCESETAPAAAERAVIEAAVRLMTPPSAAGVATVLGPRLHGAILDLQAARAAAPKDGAR